MHFMKTLIIAGLVFSTGLLWTIPAGSEAGDTDQRIPQALVKAQSEIQKNLDNLNTSLEIAARDLAKEKSLNSRRVHSILGKLCADTRGGYVVDCCTIDPAGRIAAMEPETYQPHEGADIAKQEQVVRLHQTKLPVLSLNMPMVEGFDAVDVEWPIIGERQALKGAVSILIKPEVLVAVAIGPVIEGLPVNIWVMQKNGRILYDVHKDEIGRDLFTDPLYKPYGQLLALGKKIADEPTGSGFYEYLKEGPNDVVKKLAHWTTVGLHGTEWRVVMAQVVAGGKEAEASTIDSKGMISQLRVLTSNQGFRQSMAAGDENAVTRIFRRFCMANPGLYSVQWIDAKGINRFGYPPENSLRNYDMRLGKCPEDLKLMEAVDSRKEAILDLALLERGMGVFSVVPVTFGDRYLGAVYAIQLKAETAK
jgi:hypothetical protein